MQLFFETARLRWEGVTKFGDPAVPALKAAGFRWDPKHVRWQTADVLAAMKLRDYADDGTRLRLDAEAAAALEAKAAADAAATRAVAASRATDADIFLPCGPGRTFLPYQRAGIAFALARPNMLIGDDMGLGKTAQAIGFVNADESLRKVLVICPASLARNWVREFGFFGSRPLSTGIATMKEVPGTDIVIATYDVFSRSTAAAEAIRAATWDVLVLDEAHFLKNGESKRTRAILGANGIQVSKRRIYLTGTPVTNRPIELWPLVHSLAPAEFDDKFSFARRYCNAHRNDYGWDFSGASNLEELQDRLRATVMVRRLKKDVLTELPPKRRQMIELPADTPELRAALRTEAESEAGQDARLARLRAAVADSEKDGQDYQAAVQALRAGAHVRFTELARVRHLTAMAKAPVVAGHVREVVEAGAKVLVFAHHKDVVDILRRALADPGVVEITGGTAPAKRQGIVDRFQQDPEIRVFVGNIMAAGVGLTLTASAHVVFAELDWAPGNLSQAEDRAHRLGQRNAVLVQHLVLEGSIDAKMAKTVMAKQEVIDAALDNVEDPEERARRIAEFQAAFDAEVEGALESAKARQALFGAAGQKREADRAARKASRAEAIAEAIERAAARAAAREDRINASIVKMAQAIKAGEPPDDAARAAIIAGLGVLSALDPDGATERNDAGYNKPDSYHGHFLARLASLDDAQAIVGRDLVRKYQRQLDPGIVALALGEPLRERKATKPGHAAAEGVPSEAVEARARPAEPSAEKKKEPATTVSTAPRTGSGDRVATEPKIRFRLETGQSCKTRGTAHDPTQSSGNASADVQEQSFARAGQ